MADFKDNTGHVHASWRCRVRGRQYIFPAEAPRGRGKRKTKDEGRGAKDEGPFGYGQGKLRRKE